jgi:SAM-dependent methyltransferase
MVSARHARHVWATDITERAALYCEFNRRFAGLNNMSVLTGDLYAPVEGLTFDRIMIHPPYVPAQQNQVIFRDGGEDGEQVIRGAVQGLARFLRPGGHFYALVMASDRAGETFEQRLRKWLGSQENEFDVATGIYTAHSPAECFTQSLLQGGLDSETALFLDRLWRTTATELILYAAVLIERHASTRPAQSARFNLVEQSLTVHHLESLFDANLGPTPEGKMGCRGDA